MSTPTPPSASGSGALTVDPSSVPAGGSTTLAIRYVAAESMAGGELAVRVPVEDGWTAPSTAPGAGHVSVSSAGTVGRQLDPLDSAEGWTTSGLTLAIDSSDLQEGSGSLRADVVDGRAGDTVARVYTASTSWSSFQRIGFWVKSSAPLVAGQIAFFTRDAQGTAIQSTGLPALSADTWTYVTLPLSGTRGSVKTWGWQLGSALSRSTLHFDAARFVVDDAESATGWVGVGSGAAALDTSQPREGSAALRVDFVAGAASGSGAAIDLSPSTQDWSSAASLALWVRPSVAVSAGSLAFSYWADAAQPGSSITLEGLPALPAGAWSRVRLSLTGERAAVRKYGLVCQGTCFGGAAASVLVDGVGLRPESLDTLSPATTTNHPAATLGTLGQSQRQGTAALRATLPASLAVGERLYRTYGSPQDWSSATALGVWLRASDAPSAEGLALFYSADADGSTATQQMAVPALSAGSWAFVTMPLSQPRTAVRSWGLRVASPLVAAAPWTIDLDEALIGTSNPVVDGAIVDVRTLALGPGQEVVLSYAGATAPAVAGASVFQAQMRADPLQQLSNVGGGATVQIAAAVPSTTPTVPSTATPTRTSSATPSVTPVSTGTPLPTATPSPTTTGTPTATASAVPVATSTPTITPTTLPTTTPTPPSSATPTRTPTLPATPPPQLTPQPSSTATPSATAVPSFTPVPSATSTSSPTPTSTPPVATATSSPTDTPPPPSDPPTPTSTPTDVPTPPAPTATPTATATPPSTNTPVPTATPAPAPATPTSAPPASTPLPVGAPAAGGAGGGPNAPAPGTAAAGPSDPAATLVPTLAFSPEPAGPTATPSESTPVSGPVTLQMAMLPLLARVAGDVVTDPVDQAGARVIAADGSLGIEIPAGATVEWFVLAYYPAPPDETVEAPEGLVLALPVVELSGTNGAGLPVALSPPATIVLQYLDDELASAGLDEGTLVVRLLDPFTGAWIDVPAVVDPEHNQIVLETSVLGALAVFAAPVLVEPGEPGLATSPTEADEAAPPGEAGAVGPAPDLGDAEQAAGDSAPIAPGEPAPATEQVGTDEAAVSLAPPVPSDPRGGPDPEGGGRSRVAQSRQAALPGSGERRADWSGADG